MFDSTFSTTARQTECWLHTADGGRTLLPVQRWLGTSQSLADTGFDRLVIDWCDGPTVDLGCGPGRLVRGLADHDICALGVDQSPVAVAMTRAGGGVALQRNVFDRLPGEGHWQHVLLIDGNIGIGGDPVRMLRRAARLADVEGSVIVEIDARERRLWRGAVRVETVTALGEWFPWARVGVGYVDELAAAVGLRVRAMERSAGRVLVEYVRQSTPD
ncbi:class I SAM-dependent methyltransferase [Williamsia sterculiae]|uniref:Methyltransferase domain-containing protein n=1 Tax=Williamsia sterculiae TaxID=1344003 RepID=A0A1N7CFZ6_9NOCA|nr:class I SAM-dependent methyltransferase [Williamsia sterculiae]SIR62364.1 hypothetical protein SAMN05445060_0103 [Williamsia sterculiae]